MPLKNLVGLNRLYLDFFFSITYLHMGYLLSCRLASALVGHAIMILMCHDHVLL
jgi:hypothetical protein